MKRMSYTKPNVLALLDDRKFNTRRIIKPQPSICPNEYRPTNHPNSFLSLKNKEGGIISGVMTTKEFAQHAPYQVGDEIGVAEGYQITGHDILFSGHTRVCGKYLCDDAHFSIELTLHERELWIARKYPYRPTPGRFMYNSLIRIKYTLTGVGVERLQDISGADAVAEGLRFKDNEWARDNFIKLWNTIHGNGAWDLNLYVWVYKWDEIRILGE